MSIDAYDYGKQDGIDQERQRVIDVLASDTAFDAVYYGDGGADEALGYLIKLIKGEIK